MDVAKLLSALENEDNSSLLELDLKKISAIKNDILQKLNMSREILKDFNKKLKKYRYVEDLSEIKFGSYIRWIPLKDPTNIKLTNGGFICDVKVLDAGIHILCRNGFNRIFQLSMDENLIFQKLNDEEMILLKTLDHLEDL